MIKSEISQWSVVCFNAYASLQSDCHSNAEGLWVPLLILVPVQKSFTDFFISYKATTFRNARWAADAHEFIPYLLGELALVPQWIALGESMCQCHIVQHNASRNYISQTFLPDAASRRCLLAFSHCCSIWWSTSMHFFSPKGSSQGDRVGK